MGRSLWISAGALLLGAIAACASDSESGAGGDASTGGGGAAVGGAGAGAGGTTQGGATSAGSAGSAGKAAVGGTSQVTSTGGASSSGGSDDGGRSSNGGASPGGAGGESETTRAGAGGTGGEPSAGGATGEAGANAGAGGEPERGDSDGLSCRAEAIGPVVNACAPQEICVECDNFGNLVPRICVPHPELDPDGFAAGTQNCGAVYPVSECDGPEDCDSGELCVLDPDDDYSFGACSAEPPACETDAECIVCNDDAECPDGVQCAPPLQGSGRPGRTCGPGLAQLLDDGVWLVGWSGDLDHYSWLRFMPSSEGASEGALEVLDAECVTCTPYVPCAGADGSYSVPPGTGEVSIEYPSACASEPLSFSFETLNRGPAGLPESASLGYVVVDGPRTIGAYLYSPSFCDAEFTSCVVPWQ